MRAGSELEAIGGEKRLNPPCTLSRLLAKTVLITANLPITLNRRRGYHLMNLSR